MVVALTIGLGVVLVASLAALVTAGRRARAARRRMQEELAGSRREVAELAGQVSRLAAEVEAGRRRSADQHGYVITTLAEAAQVSGSAPAPTAGPVRSPLADALEEQAVSRLEEVDTTTRAGVRVADAGVRAVALAHGLRRALSQENRDRASAAAHLARRQSRRTRRQELREARRLLRAVRAQQPMPGPGSEGAA